jgi:hypothetical protein
MTREIPSAQVWFAGGERIGYDPNARAIVQTPGDALRVFLRREGDLAHAVSFLPGFPDGSFGWAKVLPHLPSGADMPKLFLDYVGMGDSDKPKDYAYSTAERTDLVEAIWRAISACNRRRWLPSTFPRLSFSSICGVGLSAPAAVHPPAGPKYAAFSSSMEDSSRTGTPTLGTRRRCYAVSRTEPARVLADRCGCSRGCQEYGRCGPKTIA